MDISLIAVVYNYPCDKVQAFNQEYSGNLKKSLLDNSVDQKIKDFNKEYCSEHGIVYYDNGGNVGLAKAYNRAVKDLKDNQALAIFDEDTAIPSDFLERSVKWLNDNDIVAPTVKSNGEIISPCSLSNKRVVSFNGANITAINSGMIIKKSAFDKVGLYNEQMFLDYIDHEFMERCNKSGIKIGISSCQLEQNFFAHGKVEKEKALNRFNIFLKDFKIFCDKNVKYFKAKTFKMALKNFVKYKSCDFFKARKGVLK